MNFTKEIREYIKPDECGKLTAYLDSLDKEVDAEFEAQRKKLSPEPNMVYFTSPQGTISSSIPRDKYDSEQLDKALSIPRPKDKNGNHIFFGDTLAKEGEEEFDLAGFTVDVLTFYPNGSYVISGERTDKTGITSACSEYHKVEIINSEEPDSQEKIYETAEGLVRRGNITTCEIMSVLTRQQNLSGAGVKDE